MSLDENRCIRMLENYPELDHFRIISDSRLDALPNYEHLNNLRDRIPEELYAYCFRELLKMNTANVSPSYRLNMFKGVSRESIMHQDELDAFAAFDEYVTVYRGTVPNESEPGLSWTLKRRIAEAEFDRGVLLKAIIPKDTILAYFNDQDEEEIIAPVPPECVQEL